MITCKNDRLLELLWFVGYCIEFPTQLAVRIGGGAEWNRRVMYRAIREGYVRLYRKKHKRHVIRSMSLTQKGFEYVAQRDPEAVSMIYSRVNSSERIYPGWIDKILRLHAIAIGTVMSMTILSSTPLVRSTVRTGSKSILALRKVNPIMRRNLNMKLNRLLTLCCALSMALGMVTFASAADYSFKTSPDPVYYGSTNYEDLYDAEYRYGSRNQIDYDIPEIQYGLSQEFLESSLNNPYLNGNTQYGFGGSSSNTQYPESDFGSSSIISGGGTIEMPYEPSVTLNDLKQSDGSIGQVSIERVGLNCKVYEGATDSSMSKGAGHYTSSGLYTGNVGLFGHNRGNHPYFGKLKNVKVGDIVKYKTAIGTKTYKVTFVGAISYTDFSYLNEMGDNRITLITCIANQPSLRLCVQAVEIR